MNIRFYNIEWDTDDEPINLPNDVILEVDDDVDVSLTGADALSDKFDWCVAGFEWERSP